MFVSISQSRYFSFQVLISLTTIVLISCSSFQSRNRDTSLFRARDAHLTEAQQTEVSISQSRYFSFQGGKKGGITKGIKEFQSRNRDTSLFR